VNFSLSEILVVLLIALLVVKPEQLPEVASSLVRFIRSVRGVFAKVKNEMTGLMDDVDKTVSDQLEQKK
jgi:Sec-independent protein translocase protein TatA